VSILAAAPTLRDRVGGEPTLLDAVGGEPTLDELLSGAWEGLVAHQAVECPVCRGAMEPDYDAHAFPVGGRCGACGTTVR
jgi:hypothetical protein